jgi:inosose dehydratase
MTDRRNFLKATGLGVAAAGLPGLAHAAENALGSQAKASPLQKGADTHVKLGVASYTLREFSTTQALDMTLRCGVDRITFKDMHLPLDSGQESIKKTLELCKKKGVTLYGAGVITIRTREAADQAFDYARAAGLELITCNPAPEMLEYMEGKVKEYAIKAAIHNHGPDDNNFFPSGVDAYKYVSHMDPRMGLCLDIGHTRRLGRDPVADFRQCFDRVFDVHIKDVTTDKKEGVTCIAGRGVIDLVAFLKTVREMGYQGTLALEYEKEENDPLPAMMASLGYIKGVLAALKTV